MSEQYELPYAIRRWTFDRFLIIELHGEIDILVAAANSDLLAGQDLDRQPDVVVDLTAVTFIDCSGLGVLCQLANRLRRRGRLLRLVVADSFTLKVLRATRLTEVFLIHDSLSAALSHSDGAAEVPAS
ncbi:STAS domain-containing protein [Streptomyces sp. AC563]|uniref:STAS domain-containing protein n=1 Tax=Streptomyces buecherae TaxID=2763006 RepID=UPI00164E10EA|nr:STAS domain-containing protein [Streptomyces buecherae]MBC3981918.1 STAS domain-containing protein [Streptomyces buecherae]MBC3987778.1 STAS domain-containing protein [Streptomyces buecherae]QNJ43816.1 STAS domain-containing protein [Streptomyces buecherae]